MTTAKHSGLTTLICALTLCCGAIAEAQECPVRAVVDAHARQQFSIYGPQSIDREYFGFIYLLDDTIGSAVIQGRKCPDKRDCGLNTAEAATLIPRGAKVLGEWHTHPRGGSAALSTADVRGAYNNRHIRCYVAFYSKPDGEVYAWDPHQTSVPTATATLTRIGNFHEKLVEPANEPVRYADRQP